MSDPHRPRAAAVPGDLLGPQLGITENWRGRPLLSREVIVNLFGSTRTEAGLRMEAALDSRSYPKGAEVSDEEMAGVRIKRDKFHGEWNYTISPRNG